MVFDTSTLRTLKEDHTPNFGLRDNRSATLIRIASTGEITFARTRQDKDSMLAAMNWEEDVLLWPWIGQWYTDIFRLSKKDTEKYYEDRKGKK